MAGLIRRTSIDEVRSRARIDEVVGQHVTLKPAGVGSLKGLCPFHDEKTPSFHVRPHVGLYHCFGCGAGGDVISFVQNIDHVTFTEAVERLADSAGVRLEYEDDDGRGAQRAKEVGTRHRLVAANTAAEEYFREQLATSEAALARRFLAERGFDAQAAARFSVGYAPAGWENLLRHLRGRGFTEEELVQSGLATRGQRGIYDRFRGRLIWPIRDITGQTVGFGARRLREDDQGPKYLNTPETPLYHKSQVLYGLDLAKRDIVRAKQVVIVEGYTDVMAAHLAGVTTAVATCGTAFGSEHAKIIRRLLGSGADAAAGLMLASGARGGEVVFTFDGDEAGQKAALRAFAEDQNFAAGTFVAISPAGLDPCDLRLQRGDQAVRDLVASREPLFEFVVRSALAQLDLSTVEGRVAGLRAAAPVVATIRDRAMRLGYARELAGWLGMDEDEVRQAVRRSSRYGGRGGARGGSRGGPDVGGFATGGYGTGGPGGEGGAGIAPDAVFVGAGGGAGARRGREDPIVRLEREALEVVLQMPHIAHNAGFDQLDEAFTVPLFRAVHDAIRAAGGTAAVLEAEGQAQGHEAGVARWLELVLDNAEGPVGQAVRQLAVAPLPEDRPEEFERFARGVLTSLARLVLTRHIGRVKGDLGRMAPDSAEYPATFTKLLELEERRRSLVGD